MDMRLGLEGPKEIMIALVVIVVVVLLAYGLGNYQARRANSLLQTRKLDEGWNEVRAWRREVDAADIGLVQRRRELTDAEHKLDERDRDVSCREALADLNPPQLTLHTTDAATSSSVA